MKKRKSRILEWKINVFLLLHDSHSLLSLPCVLIPSSLHSLPQEKKVPGGSEYLLMPVLQLITQWRNYVTISLNLGYRAKKEKILCRKKYLHSSGLRERENTIFLQKKKKREREQIFQVKRTLNATGSVFCLFCFL